MTIIIPITPAMQKRANDLAEKIERTGLFSTPNYTGLSVNNRFYVGYIGEFVVAKALEEHHKRYWHHIKADGRSQLSEFVIHVEGKPYRLEVKTASQKHHKYFAMPQAQSLDAAVYVGVRLEGDAGNIMGWLSRKEVEILPCAIMPPHTISTRMKKFSELRDIGEVLSKIDGAVETVNG